MGWVRKTEPPPVHECSPPVEERVRLNHNGYSVEYLSPQGANRGDLWRCDDCQKLWQVIEWNVSNGDNYLDWEPASFWNRWKYPAPKYPWPEPTKPVAVRQDQELPPQPGQTEAERWGDIPD